MPAWVRIVLVVGCLVLAAGTAVAQGYSVLPGAGGQEPAAANRFTVGGAGRTAGRPAPRVTAPRAATVTARRPEDYGGISPGSGAVPPGLGRRHARRGLVVAWPGFQMIPNGSRVFLALTAEPPGVQALHQGHSLVFRIPGARVPLSNNRRPLVTEGFDTPVQRAYLRQHGNAVDLVIELRAPAEPQVNREANPQGLHYVYVDFGPFHVQHAPLLPGITQGVPGGPQITIQPVAPGSVPPDGPLDTERPPPVQR